MPALPQILRQFVGIVSKVGTKAVLHSIMIMISVLVKGFELLAEVVVSFADSVFILLFPSLSVLLITARSQSEDEKL